MKKLFLSVLLMAGVAHAQDMSAIPMRGEAQAPVSLTIYGGFECQFTAEVVRNAQQLMAKHKKDFNIFFRHYPLDNYLGHPRESAVAAVCAQVQGKFWPMFDKFFERNYNINPEFIQKTAVELNLNLEQFNECLASEAASARVDTDIAAGNILEMWGTPTMLFVGPGGTKQEVGAMSAKDLKKIIDSVKKKK